MSKPVYIWSDAWLLTSIDYATSAVEGNLAAIIGAGDYINHAIFTMSELNGGLSRLVRGGLIKDAQDGYELTDEGVAATGLGKDTRMSAFKHLTLVGERIGAEKWQPGADPNDCDDAESTKEYVSKKDLDDAYIAYKKSIGKSSQ